MALTSVMLLLSAGIVFTSFDHADNGVKLFSEDDLQNFDDEPRYENIDLTYKDGGRGEGFFTKYNKWF